jgi:hypothetical protein
MNKQERIGKMVQEIHENLDRVERMEEPLFDEYTNSTYTDDIRCAYHMYGDDVYVNVSMELYEYLPNIVALRCTVSRRGGCGYTTSCIRGSKNNIEKGVEVLDKMIIANIKQVKDIEF